MPLRVLVGSSKRQTGLFKALQRLKISQRKVINKGEESPKRGEITKKNCHNTTLSCFNHTLLPYYYYMIGMSAHWFCKKL